MMFNQNNFAIKNNVKTQTLKRIKLIKFDLMLNDFYQIQFEHMHPVWVTWEDLRPPKYFVGNVKIILIMYKLIQIKLKIASCIPKYVFEQFYSILLSKY